MTRQTWIAKIMGDDGLKRIERAVGKAEANTSGEIVPVLVRRSAVRGHIGQHLALLFFALLFPIDYLARSLFTTPYVELIALGIWLSITIALFLLLPRYPWVIRILTPRADLASQVEQRALLEFYQTAMAKTQGKTGIMIMASFTERHVVVLAEEGIAAKLPETTWQEVVAVLTYELKRGKVVQGFEQAIAKCGEILAPHFPKHADDRNEIPDRLIIRDDP